MKTLFDRVGEFEIIDFHTHPFSVNNNICAYKRAFDMREEEMIPLLRSLGISAMCGSVIQVDDRLNYANAFEKIKTSNREALALAERLGGFYIPGFHVHPDYVDESIEEIRFMSERGVKLIGELVPYHDSWDSYAHEGLCAILEEAEKHGMVVSFHTMSHATIDTMVAAHPGVTFVAAHPGETDQFYGHIERMKKYGNLYLDISGTGLYRYHSLALLVKELGSERILFGSDYPTCNPGCFIGGVLCEPLSDSEFENIFSKNAKRLLGL